MEDDDEDEIMRQEDSEITCDPDIFHEDHGFYEDQQVDGGEHYW